MSIWSLVEAKKYADRDKVLIAESGADLQALADKLDDSGGGVLQLLPNTIYTIPTTLTLGDNTILRGAGWSSVITIPNNAPLVEYQVESARLNHVGGICKIFSTITNKNHTGDVNKNIVIENLTIDGNGYNQPTNREHWETGIWFFNTEHCRVVNSKVIDINPNNTFDSLCVTIMFSKDTKIIGGYFSNVAYECIGVRDGAYDTLISGATVKKARVHSIQCPYDTLRRGIGGGGTVIEGCIIDNTESETGNGITSHRGNDIVISNNVIKSNSCAIYLFDDSHRISVIGNNIHGGVKTIALGGIGLSEEIMSDNIIVSGNTIVSNHVEYGSYGIWIESMIDNVQITNNIVKADKNGIGIHATGASNITISGNSIDSSTANNIYLGDSTNHVTVVNNRTISGLRGCADDGSTEYVIVEGNDFSAATSSTEKIRINGTNNIIKNNLPMDAENPPVG